MPSERNFATNDAVARALLDTLSVADENDVVIIVSQAMARQMGIWFFSIQIRPIRLDKPRLVQFFAFSIVVLAGRFRLAFWRTQPGHEAFLRPPELKEMGGSYWQHAQPRSQLGSSQEPGTGF
jgi:hypothetical protein